MRIVTLVVGLAQSVALAQAASPSVVPFPLEVTRPTNLSEKQRDELQAAYKAVLRRSGALLPDSAKQAAALKELKRSDCDRDNECLAQLARLAGTLYAVFASVDLTAEGNVVGFGRVVRDDGKQVAEVGRAAQVKLPKGRDSFSSLVPIVLARLFEQLKVAGLPLAKEAVEPKPPEVKPDGPRVELPPPPPPPPPPVVVTPSPTMKVAGWTAVGVGAGAAVIGAVVFATTDLPRVNEHGSVLVEDKAKINPARAQQAAGVGVLVGGLGVAAIGGVLLGLAPSDGAPKTNVSLVPVNGGAVAVVGGTF
jgi:hypothetical protein